MSLPKKIQHIIREYPLVWATIGIIFAAPPWISGTWQIFSDKPLFRWLQSHGINMNSFPLKLIVSIFGFSLLGYTAWQSYLHRKESKKSPLDFEAITNEAVIDTRYIFQIRLLNKSQDRNADSVEVELVSFTDEFEGGYADKPKEQFHPKLPLPLKPANGVKSINPGDGLEFTVFSITKVQGMVNEFVATFRSDDDPSPLPRTAIFRGNKKYQIEVAASAREMPPIQRRFEMEFIDKKGDCRFTIKPIYETTDVQRS